MFRAALFTVTKRWKQSKRSSADGCVNKTGFIQTTGYYSAFKRKEMLTQATTWTDLEDVMLSDIS